VAARTWLLGGYLALLHVATLLSVSARVHAPACVAEASGALPG
jgi:hypothetical protein